MTAANTIYDNMKVDAPSTDFKAVKAAFESIYVEVGISRTDIGGLWNEGGKKYYFGMEPCTKTIPTMNFEVETKNNNS